MTVDFWYGLLSGRLAEFLPKVINVLRQNALRGGYVELLNPLSDCNRKNAACKTVNLRKLTWCVTAIKVLSTPTRDHPSGRNRDQNPYFRAPPGSAHVTLMDDDGKLRK